MGCQLQRRGLPLQSKNNNNLLGHFTEHNVAYYFINTANFDLTPLSHIEVGCPGTGLEITAGQRTMSGLIVDLTSKTFVLPVMLTCQNSIVLKMK